MKTQGKNAGKSGFTLVETMVVVTIIGLLASLSIPGVQSARKNSVASRFANDFRTYSAAFEVYATENGRWPDDVNRGVIPPEMDGQLRGFDQPSYQNSRWDWDYQVAGITAGVTLRGTIDTAILARVDSILDDGNLSSGRFRSTSSGATYILQE